MIPTRLHDGEHFDAVVVGGGQAGLAVSWHLVRSGVRHVVIERETVAHEWREGRWDNFTLVTPNWHCRLPGYAYEGPDPDGFMARDEVFAWTRQYADTFDAPVAEGVSVTQIELRPGGGFVVHTSAGTITADSVTSATGGYHLPVTPAWAGDIPAGVFQLHSHEYRNAAQLPDGPVLVIGSGQSGTQIAEDLLLEGREVHLALGRAPRVARFYRGKDCMTWLAEMGVYDVAVTTRGLAKRESTNHYVTGRDGGRDIDLREFALRGMRLHGRATSFSGGAFRFDESLGDNLDYADSVAESIKNDIDRYIEREGIEAPFEPRRPAVWHPGAAATSLPATEVASVIWSIGFRADWSWLGDLDVLDHEGHPVHSWGATQVAGFQFIGLPWMRTWGSGRFHAIARDAEHIADVIGATLDERARVS
ncbi:MSMEG_0569 family flavin-dependent oxidoreductase [Microbacterium halotolerans]|uniref:MSMEG_0569 family flavin-dependent oxidoreductase n=1 Tax=Microbacterium halotolerans TaxID=246613 RepID=UPI000E6A96C1|nr:MSMEG_0569 family flavin-dependent oxidoreductase [Microbacterium halotolerans]